MKTQNHFLRRLRRLLTPQKGKEGSSLGMVVIIGSVLVIWVMSLMPLMTATGTAAIGVQSGLDDYLISRSSIEYAKSELTYQVREDIPRTFAVIKNDDTFSVINKWSSASTVTTEYMQYVSNDAGRNDHLDVPQDNASGDKVTCICSVMQNASEPSKYDIIITTYADGEKELTYTTTYTLSGNLLIYPESYKQHQALPLSDFVLVDGKLGANVVWESTISDKTDTSFTETLLPWLSAPDAGYADAGEYPVVFKTPALTPTGGGSIGDPQVEKFTDQEWIMPHWNANKNTEGAVWVDTSNNKVVPKMYLNGSAVDASAYCTVYFNGVAGTTLPTRGGTYKITVDTIGTLTEDPNDADGTTVEGCYVLPAKGIEVGTYTVDSSRKHDKPSAAFSNVSYDNKTNTFDVTINKVSGTKLGYTTKANGTELTWMDCTSDSVQLNDLPAVSVDPNTNVETDLTYYFYCYRPASIDGENNVTSTSDVQYVGMVYPFKAVKELEHGAEYLVMGNYNNKYYCLNISGNNNSTPGATEFPTSSQYKGSLGNGVAYGVPDSNLSVTMLKTEPNNNNSNVWQFTRGTVNAQGNYSANKYLQLSARYSNRKLTLSTKIVTSADDNTKLNLEFKDTAVTASKELSYTSGYTSGKTTGYLKITNSVKCESTAGNIYFVKAPVPGVSTVEVPGYTVEERNYTIDVNDSNNTASGLKGMIPHNLTKLYANGTEVTGALNVGIYKLMGSVQVDDVMYYVSLGNLTVNKVDQSKTPSATLKQDNDDEQVVTVTASNWNGNGGIHYFGYKASGDADYHWCAATGNSYEFRLDFGTYTFAVYEGGTNSYNASAVTTTSSLTINAQRVELNEESRSEFWYTVKNVNGEIVVTWYKLPAGVTPSKITMVYGTPVGESDISWSYEYSSGVRYYGVNVLGSDYKDLNSVLKLDTPLDHTASMLRGEALYFMGENYSIDTNGNTVYLYADLLVLRNPINGNGQILVYPYTTGEETQGDTLAFFDKDVGPFKAKNFYRIPAGTDLNNVSASKAAEYQAAVGATVANGDGTYTFPESVKVYFRQNLYPEINLDVAYASKEQLMRIISSETMNWTNDGVLRNSSTEDNESYVVCAFISEIQGSVSYCANRVLIAANDASGTHTLTVPANLSFTTRYLSIDANTMIQGDGNVHFNLYNLGQKQSFIQKISNALGLTNYRSKTLQMDYERHTTVVYANSYQGSIKPQICRYEDGADLFGGAVTQPLLATYTTTDIKNLFGKVTGTVKTVDRYIMLECDDGTGKLDVSSLGKSKLDIYANYIYIDPSLKEIEFKCNVLGGLFTGTSDICVNSQESGYTTQEYLGLFKQHSAENYNGTLIYVKNTLRITRTYTLFGISKSDPVDLAPGFYFIAATDDGTSLIEFSDNPSAIDQNTLRNYSVYVDPETGALSNAYVDTGLFDNASEGRGGFSGGNVQ